MDLFAEVAEERLAIAAKLREFTPEQQRAQSYCAAWTSHDVAAHLLMPLETKVSTYVWAMLASGGNFDRANRRLTARVAQRDFSQILDSIEARAHSRFTPPGLGPIAPLTDLVVHAQDIFMPLEIDYRTTETRRELVLNYVVTHWPAGKETDRYDGLRFEATDLEWAHGEGPLVRGPANAILLALAWRNQAAEQLEGAGLPELRGRVH